MTQGVSQIWGLNVPSALKTYTEMEMWDEDYSNLEVQAYIGINEKKLGNFQSGQASGYLDGEMADYNSEEKFEFTWEGQD